MLTFEDVLLRPGYSDIPSRAGIDLSTEFLSMDFKLPIISANMDYVTEQDMAFAMLKEGAFYVLHRFYNDPLKMWGEVDQLGFGSQPISISIGVREIDEEIRNIQSLINSYSSFGRRKLVVTVDVAHGHHHRVYDAVRRLKHLDGEVYVIAGNVATGAGYRFLAEAGADAVKVGIGPGSVCTTRAVAGVGVPMIGALMDIADVKHRSEINKLALPIIAQWRKEEYIKTVDPYRYPAIIADGGMKNSGDIVKALAAGADMVMLGSLLAGAKEAPGERRIGLDGKTYKQYRGQSIFGVNASHYTPEGIEGWVPENGPVAGILQTLRAGIRSGMSYVGARNLTELREKAEFVQVTHAGYSIESATRVMSGENL